MLQLNATRRNAKKVKNANVSKVVAAVNFPFLSTLSQFMLLLSVVGVVGGGSDDGGDSSNIPIRRSMDVCLSVCVCHSWDDDRSFALVGVGRSVGRSVLSVFCEN